ncbi:Cytochrome P450 4C1 [Pseudolycoriella hygida]|uniref:Cytochrome P450 4C1 n=1 Tax=Pseudolycoriella hygida TaxID=35572 RepID=A0A9Q0MP60_9DIPT|nr:Cytochrome P450 4C1 [Pseudolycoriella hygida]KAJ6638884.1 Cytochrome P450 4C1 [Pseudolycoriella hygida]
MIVVIVALLVVIYSVIVPFTKWYRKRAAIVAAIDKLPGRKAYPLIGTTYEFFGVDRKDLFKVFEKVVTIDPYIARFWIGPSPEVTIMKAEYAETVINSRKNLDKPFSYNYVKLWLGEGLLTSTGGKWQKHRKIITPTFHFSILESFCGIFSEKSKVLVERLSHHADTDTPINIHTFVTLAALDIISESAMGIQIDCQTQHQNEYVDAVYEISELIMHRILRPYLAPDIIYRHTASGKKFKKCLEILHNFTKDVITNRKAAREENKRRAVAPKKRQAFLDLLLDANEQQNLLTDDDIREEVDTFMFEGKENCTIKCNDNLFSLFLKGHDTTAAGISWTLYVLGLYPDIQQKVFEELKHIFNGSNRSATLEDLNEMKYLERVIKETLRLYPSVPFVGRILSEDVQLDQYTIPKGTMVTVAIYFLHRDSRFFPEPERFDPDRFLPENTVSRHPYAYLPFSAGPRNCVGQKFAMFEEKSVLSSIIRNYKIISVETIDEIDLMAELILRTHNGINVKLERRR